MPLVPVLQQRGRLRRDYAGQTLRSHLGTSKRPRERIPAHRGKLRTSARYPGHTAFLVMRGSQLPR